MKSNNNNRNPMTNAEIIATIRAEIERRLANYHPEFVNHGLASGFREDGKAIAYEELLSFLSDLEKSLPAKVEDGEVLEEEINRTYHDGSVADTSDIDHVTYENIAEHFYDLGCRRTAEKYDELEYNRQRAEESPLPEDTVLFNKGVEEGKRLMMEEAVEIGTTEICWVPDGDRVFPTFDPPVEDLLMPGIISQRFNGGDKVRVIIKKED